MGVWLIFTIIALVFCKIAGFLSSKALVAYFHKGGLTQDLKKSQQPRDSFHFFLIILLLC